MEATLTSSQAGHRGLISSA